jgi:hypothetical protein
LIFGIFWSFFEIYLERFGSFFWSQKRGSRMAEKMQLQLSSNGEFCSVDLQTMVKGIGE